MNIKFLELAQKELDETFEYYEYQQENLGYRFIYEVQEAVDRIKFYPKGWHPLSKNNRRCLIKNFPYGLIYQIKENYIFIIAVANLHREPNYWIDRV